MRKKKLRDLLRATQLDFQHLDDEYHRVCAAYGAEKMPPEERFRNVLRVRGEISA